jgi:hypothetical protein
MTDKMQRIVLASRPEGSPKDDNFRLETVDMPIPGEGEVLVKVLYMSLDPYMRGRMDDAKSYAAPVPVGGTMEGGAVGEVIASNSDSLKPGDIVFGMFGWASHAVQPAKLLRKLDPAQGPVTAALGVLGMPGFTGWFGLMVGQIARLHGLRVVGIAGGPEKCQMAKEVYGFDDCLDHRAFDTASDLRKALKEACPDGVDIYFENVGGKVLDAVLPLMNPHGRIPVCGMIAWYDAGGLGAGAASESLTGPRLWRSILVNFLSVNGFIISNHFDRYPEFLNEVAPRVAKGEIAFVEDIAEGLENAPAAFMSMLKGGNKGKQIVKIA